MAQQPVPMLPMDMPMKAPDWQVLRLSQRQKVICIRCEVPSELRQPCADPL